MVHPEDYAFPTLLGDSLSSYVTVGKRISEAGEVSDYDD